MNNDLISREALKEAIKEIFDTVEVVLFDDIIATIDNAPTVAPHYVSDLPDDVVKTLQTLAIDYSDGIAIFERKRPQGEWVHLQAIGDYTCSICGCDNLYKYANEHERWVKTNSNFCPNCGAKMGGKEK